MLARSASPAGDELPDSTESHPAIARRPRSWPSRRQSRRSASGRSANGRSPALFAEACAIVRRPPGRARELLELVTGRRGAQARGRVRLAPGNRRRAGRWGSRQVNVRATRSKPAVPVIVADLRTRHASRFVTACRPWRRRRHERPHRRAGRPFGVSPPSPTAGPVHAGRRHFLAGSGERSRRSRRASARRSRSARRRATSLPRSCPHRRGHHRPRADGRLIFANDAAAVTKRVPDRQPSLLNAPIDEIMSRYELLDENDQPLDLDAPAGAPRHGRRRPRPDDDVGFRIRATGEHALVAAHGHSRARCERDRHARHQHIP